MRQELTPKQLRFLEYLRERIERTGYAPSLRQTAADLGISHAAAAQFIRALEDKGRLKREGRYSRTITLLEKKKLPPGQQRWREVPIIGRIAAGLPLYAQQEYDGAIVVDGDVYRGDNLFALRVAGDSMQEAGILASDLVICEPRQYAANNEIVVALIGSEEATVKRFFLRRNGIELRPANAAYSAKRYGFGEVLIQGKVIGVIRGPEGL
jgi:repressor LexA